MIVSAKIKRLEAHPQSRQLKICQVFDGTKVYQVVCGAFNAREGMITIFAPVGSTTPSGITIQEAQLRGISSFGMLCSAKDLNISQEGGLIDLPEHTPLGTPSTHFSKDQLSSTPWHQYKLCQSYVWNQSEQRFSIHNGPLKELTDSEKLTSQTYFHNGHYLHRHYR